MITKIIETEEEYDRALARVDQLWNTPPNMPKAEELKLLLLLIEKYEDEHYTIDSPDPIEAIKVRMDELNLKPKDMIPIIGDKGTVSKILNRKIPLSLSMIRRLSQRLSLPADILIQEVSLSSVS
ncbi:MAG: transcriptional regulator [Bacteroidota bacterium]